MNNNRLAFFIGCGLLIVSGLLSLFDSVVDVGSYMIIGAALVLGGTINEALGE